MSAYAAQTIKVSEKETEKVKTGTKESKRYEDAKFVNEKYVNAWQMRNGRPFKNQCNQPNDFHLSLFFILVKRKSIFDRNCKFTPEGQIIILQK